MVFIPVMLLLMEQSSLTKWIITMVAVQRQFVPLFFFLIIAVYILFLIIKAVVQWHHCRLTGKVKTRLGHDFLLPFTIDLHRWLFAFLTAVMMIYVLKTILDYAYHISIPFLNLLLIISKVAMVAGILLSWFFLEIAIPFIRKGHTYERALQHFDIVIFRHWKKNWANIIMQFILIAASVVVFKFIINLLIQWQQNNLFNIRLFSFNKPETTLNLLYNMGLLMIGFLFSNLLFYPFIFLTKKAFVWLNLQPVSK
ncbi:MAG TPA: hypothetical protein PLF50_01665 [Candidatus Cloacimonadota bacterium]|nr:hypothetical protein [Candidatus Cloacimonadota bacterium]